MLTVRLPTFGDASSQAQLIFVQIKRTMLNMGPNRARDTPKMEGEAEALRQLAQKPHFQRQFTFVDANDHGPETARIANSHAMREWKRAKKWRDRHMPPNMMATGR